MYLIIFCQKPDILLNPDLTAYPLVVYLRRNRMTTPLPPGHATGARDGAAR
jgi:hypothetical protein